MTLTGEASEIATDDGDAPGAVVVNATPALDLESRRIAIPQVLGRSPLFSQLPVDVRRRLETLGFRRRYSAGSLITHEGRSGDRAFVVLAGVAQSTVLAGRGTSVLVRALASGDLLGLPSTMVGGPPPVTVRAETAVETLVLRATDVESLMDAFPPFREAVLHHEMVSRIEAFLRRASPFAPLPPAVLAALAARMTQLPVQANETVFREGDEGDAFYVVRHGGVDVITGGETIASLRAGDCFGEAALLTGAARGATIRAREPTEILRLDRQAFDRVLSEYEEVRGFFVELLRRRDLLTPSVERAAGRTAAPQIPGGVSGDIDYAVPRAGGILALGFAALLAALAVTPRGEYLVYPAVAATFAIGPVTLLLLARALDLEQELPVRRLVLTSVVSAALTSVVMSAVAVATVLPSFHPVASVLGGAVAITCTIVAIVVLAAARQSSRLELDSMIMGTVAGLSMGLVAAVVVTTGVPGWGLMARWPVTWATMAALPLLLTAVGTLAGSAVWGARTQRSVKPILARTPLLLLLAAAAQPLGALGAPQALAPLVQIAGVAVALAPLRRRLPAAVTARAIALFTLGLSSGARALAGHANRNCRACGAPAQAAAIYCARCGLSLLDEEDAAA